MPYNPKLTQLNKSVEELQKQGKLAEAEKLALAAYAQTPDEPFVSYMLGKLYLKGCQDYPKAISYLEKAVRLDYSYAYSFLGEAYYYTDEFEKAISVFTLAIEKTIPGFPDKYKQSHRFRGKCYLKQGKHFEAIKDFAHVVANVPGQYDAQNELENTFKQVHHIAQKFLKDGEFEQGISYYERLAELAPQYMDVECYYNLGYGYLQSRRWELAQETLNRAIEKAQPHNKRRSRALYYLALAILGVSKADELPCIDVDSATATTAIKDLLDASASKFQPEAHFCLGVIYRKLGNHSEARKYLSRVPTTNGKLHALAELSLASIFKEQGLAQDSIDCLKQISDNSLLSPNLLMEFSKDFEKLGALESTRWCLDKAAALPQSNSTILKNLAQYYLILLEDKPKAKEIYQRVLKSEYEDEEALKELFSLYVDDKEIDEGFETFRKLLSFYESRKEWDKALALIDHHTQYFDTLALLADKADLYEYMEEFYKASEEWVNIANVALGKGDKETVVTALLELVHINPEDKNIDFLLGELTKQECLAAKIQKQEPAPVEEVTRDSLDIDIPALILEKKIIIVGGHPNLERKCRSPIGGLQSAERNVSMGFGHRW